MDFEYYAQSKTYYNFFDENVACRAPIQDCLKGRFGALKALFKIAAILPVSTSFKLYKTGVRFLGLALAAALLFASLGMSSGVRAFFERRVLSFSRDLADWVLYPFAVTMSLCKLFLASLLRPSLFFRF